MLLKLIRRSTHGTSVMGQLWAINSVMGDTLLCDTLENSNYLISELIYPVHVTLSPKFRRLLPLINHVPGRSGIRIHAGNQSSDSSGCVLVGHAQGTRLTNSRKVEDMLTKLLLSVDQSREDIRLEVTHYVPPTPGYPEFTCSRYYAAQAAISGRTYRPDDES